MKGRQDTVSIGLGAPDLGGDEELGAALDEATPEGLGNGVAERALGVVDGSGVEVAVAEGDGVQHHRSDGVWRWRWEASRAKADHRHQTAAE